MAQIKAVAFDLDHTLYDRYSTLRSIAYRFRMDYASRLNPELSAAQLGEIMVQTDKRYIYDDGWPGIYRQLCAQGIFREPPGQAEWIHYILGLFGQIAVPYPVTVPILRLLREQGYRTALITNGGVPLQTAKLRLLDLCGRFDALMISGALGIAKPDPEIFRLTASQLGCATEEMAYVGDHPKNDIAGSGDAGSIPIWVKTSGCWPFPTLMKPKLSIRDITELPALLEHLKEEEIPT